MKCVTTIIYILRTYNTYSFRTTLSKDKGFNLRLALFSTSYQSYCDLRQCDANEFRYYSSINCKECVKNPLHLCSHNFFNGPILRRPDCLKPSSKLEETVNILKEKAKQEGKKSTTDVEKRSPKKKTLWDKLKDEARHYYHGSQLLYLNIKVSSSLLKRSLKGQKLTRREKKLLNRTVADLFKLIPFSAFVLIPFLEFTLPVFLVLFPGMLPSTFETKNQKESKIKKKFKMQLEMATFLQDTLNSMNVQGKGVSQKATGFSEFFKKVRSSGEVVSPEEVVKFSKLFRDEITLYNLSRAQLKALCKILGIRPLGTTGYLRYQLELKLRKLKIDDQIIYSEGINSLNYEELEVACLSRGIPVLGASENKLRKQLSQWIELSVVKDLPPSLLLLSQVFTYSSDAPTAEKLAATIQALPEEVGTATKAEIQNISGKMDYKTECQCIREEMVKCEEERKECASRDKEEKKQKNEIESALSCILSRKLRLEKEKLANLKNQMQAYEEDEKELKNMLEELGECNIREPKAAIQLKNKVKKMIDNLSGTLSKIENLQENKDEKIDYSEIEVKECSEIVKSLNVSESTKKKILKICRKLDRNKNGRVSAQVLLKLSGIIENLHETMTSEQIEEIIDMLYKEDMLEAALQMLDVLKNKKETVAHDNTK